MTTKIITKGRDTYHATCTECACQFTYQRSDVHHNFRNGAEEVSCPHCGHGCHHFGARRRGCSA